MLTGEAAATGAPLGRAKGRTNDGELAPAAILVEQVRLLHDNALLSQLVALVNAGILCLVQWSMVDHGIIVAWLGCIGLVSILRLAQSRAFGRVNPSARTIGIWRNRFLIGVGASGTLWGVAGVLFFPHQSLPHQVFTSFVVAGMVAGSVATLSPLLSAFVLFSLPALTPIVLQFLLPGGELHFPMSVMAVLYGLGMLAVAKNVNTTLRTSLSLSHVNGELVRVLTQAKSRADSLNRSLQAEVSERQVKEEALRDSEASLAEAQRMAHLGSWSYDVANHAAYWSAETFRIYGLDSSGTVPSCKELLTQIHPADRKRVQRMFERSLDGRKVYETDFRVLTPSGELRWIHALWQPQTGADGKTSYLRGTVLDITERKRQERQLESEHRVLRSIATGRTLREVLELLCHTVEEQMGTAVCSVLLLDADGIHLRDAAGPSLPRSYRRAVDGVMIGPCAGSCGTAAYLNRQVIVSDIEHDPLWAQYREVALAHGLRACWSTPVSGASRPVLGTFAIYFREPREPTPAEKSVIARASNIAKIAIERDEAGHRIRQLAHFDELTSLPNRSLFNQSLDHALRQAERSKTSLALLFVDLDRFKNINDTLGHDAGDRLLREVAARLRGCLRDSDLVARFGGDEFMILLEDLPDTRFAGTVAEKLLEALARPLVLDDQEFHVTGSIGISTFPEDAIDVQSLRKNADIAMYRAKDQGSGNYGYYSPQANAHSLERLTMEGQLRHAVERGELVLHYQPKQDIRTGRVTGVEALVRWQHPERGMIPPLDFIPLAEETGLIVSIGEWVLQTACTEVRRLCESPAIGSLRVAVNLSARQLADGKLVEVVARALAESGLDVSCLELEITESMVMRNTDHAVRLLTRLKEMGVYLAMDDFGTGYSSLAYLKRFPVDSIKIDRSFIQGVPDDADDSSLTQAIIAMAQSLRLKTIAEGVENERQLDFLRDHGCDEMQGYFFSRPLPLDQLEDLLRVHAARQASGRVVVGSRPVPQFWP